MKDKNSVAGNLIETVCEEADGNVFRFVIRDENRTAPSIHGSKKSLQESETEVKAVLDQLCLGERAA